MADRPIIAILGSGVMGEAIISGLLRNKVATADQIIATDPLAQRCEEITATYGVKCFAENPPAAAQAQVVILSVKPQQIGKVVRSLKGQIQPGALVLSIVAGATIRSIQEGLGHQVVVRAMPNTPAQIGEGISVWTAAPAVSQDQVDLARRILGALGQEVFMEEENYLDMATALSGTGPAYVFLFLEAMIDAGVHLGFPRRIAEQLVLQTARGSVSYYNTKKAHPASLRNEVTSPGGTSAAAIYYLEKAGFRTAISRAVWAAYERSQELGVGKDAKAPEKS